MSRIDRGFKARILLKALRCIVKKLIDLCKLILYLYFNNDMIANVINHVLGENHA